MKNPNCPMCEDNKRVIFKRTGNYTTEMSSIFGLGTGLMVPVRVSIYQCNYCTEEIDGTYEFQGEQRK